MVAMDFGSIVTVALLLLASLVRFEAIQLLLARLEAVVAQGLLSRVGTESS